MATLERRKNRFRVIFYFSGQRYTSSLKAASEREAESLAASVDRTLMLLSQGVIEVPAGADLVSFVLSAGKLTTKPKPPPIRSARPIRRMSRARSHGREFLEYCASAPATLREDSGRRLSHPDPHRCACSAAH